MLLVGLYPLDVDAAPELEDDVAAEEGPDLGDGPRSRSRPLLVSSETVAEADVTTISVGMIAPGNMRRLLKHVDEDDQVFIQRNTRV